MVRSVRPKEIDVPKFQVGDRVYFSDDPGGRGVVIHVDDSYTIRFDSGIGSGIDGTGPWYDEQLTLIESAPPGNLVLPKSTKQALDAYGRGFDNGVEIQAARKSGYEEAMQDGEGEKAAVRKLLNELYHDRARLEKVVANAAMLARETANCIQLAVQNGTGNVTPDELDMIVLGAALAQFADANAG
jgi:hypothetical protein